MNSRLTPLLPTTCTARAGSDITARKPELAAVFCNQIIDDISNHHRCRLGTGEQKLFPPGLDMFTQHCRRLSPIVAYSLVRECDACSSRVSLQRVQMESAVSIRRKNRGLSGAACLDSCCRRRQHRFPAGNFLSSLLRLPGGERQGFPAAAASGWTGTRDVGSSAAGRELGIGSGGHGFAAGGSGLGRGLVDWGFGNRDR